KQMSLEEYTYVQQMLACTFIGDNKTVTDQLKQFLIKNPVNELILNCPIYDTEERRFTMDVFCEIVKQYRCILLFFVLIFKFIHLTILSLAFVLSSNMNAQTNDIISIKEKKYTHPLIIVNGYELRYYEYQKIKPNQIDTMIVLDEIDGVNVFGEKASAGAIVIKLVPLYSRYFNSEAKKIDDLILEKVKRIAEQREEERKQKEEEERIRQEEALRIAEEFKRQEEERL